MTKNRLEAFSDGVLAIIITIMVLELKVPVAPTWDAFWLLADVFVSYLLSFVFIGIYWGNHHHLLHGVRRVNGRIIWANLNLLFWLSLVPFGTSWMGQSHFSALPVAFYAGLLWVCGFAYDLLRRAIDRHHPEPSGLKNALQKQRGKGLFSLFAYGLAIPAAFWNTQISGLLFLAVAVVWIIPDKNIEQAFEE